MPAGTYLIVAAPEAGASSFDEMRASVTTAIAGLRHESTSPRPAP
jgi:hypothetical protein